MHSHDDYKENPFLATEDIACLLRAGVLNLFLGAGVSQGFGLPKWTELVARIVGRGSDRKYLKDLGKKSDKEIAKLLNEVDDDKRRIEYLTAVHKALYLNVKKNTLPEQLVRSPLLLAVAALITGSCRGHVQRVFTYNYDNLLEQYLAMLGLAVCVRKEPSDLSTRSDVEINHVHGFLPQDWTVSDITGNLVLSGKAYRDRRAEIDKGWSLAVECSMYSKCALLLGLSADDSSVLDIFNRAKKNITRPNDYQGYWLLTPDAYARNASEVIGVGMCPIPLTKKEIPKFIFSVCQKALPQS